jgi:hypothetical protein
MSSTSFTLKGINVSNLDKNHIIPEFTETSFKTSPKVKRTKVKDLIEDRKNISLINTLDDTPCERIVLKNGIFENIFHTTISSKKIASNEILDKTYCCFHCHCDIKPNDFFIEIPIKKEQMGNYYYFECIGIVCSFECAATHISMRNTFQDTRFKFSFSLLSNMYFQLYKKVMPKLKIRPFFAFELNKKYGGDFDKLDTQVMLSTPNVLKNKYSNDGIMFCISPTLYQKC